MGLPSFTRVYHNDVYPAIRPSRPELSLKGKSVIITGGGGGIGAATARSFAEAGANVAIIGRTQSTLLSTAAGIKNLIPGATIVSQTANVTDETQVNAAFEAIHKELGQIDIFVSNAGILGYSNTIATSKLSEYWEIFETNTKGPFITVRSFLRFAAPDAVVINVSTGIAHMPPFATYSAYAASKLAGTKIFDTLQAENPELRVVSLQPCVALTNIQSVGRDPAEMDKNIEYSDTVELAGNFMVWLSSPEAKFLKGKFVWANWDVDELKSRAAEIEKSSILTVGLEGWPFEKK